MTEAVATVPIVTTNGTGNSVSQMIGPKCGEVTRAGPITAFL